MMGFLCINDYCNFSCRYCYLSKILTKNELNLNILPDIIQFCKKNNITKVELPQREPLANENLFQKTVDILLNNRIQVTGITTNLYNLSEETIDTLFKYNMHVLVSYDGIWQDIFRLDKNQKKTKIHVEKNIEKLIDNNIQYGIATTVTKHCEDLYDNVAFIHSKICPNVALNFDVVSEFGIQKETLPMLERELKKVVEDFPNIFPFFKIRNRLKNGSQYSNFVCGAGRGSITINYDGKLYPCYQVDAWKKIGISLGDVWKGIDYPEKEKFQHYDSCQKEKCNKCKTGICGICYTNSFLKTGNMLKPIEIECKLKLLLTKIVEDI